MTVSAILRRIRESGAHHDGGGIVPRQTDADHVLTHGTDDEKAKYRLKLGESRYKLDDGNQLVLRPVTEIAMLLGNTGGDDDSDGNSGEDDDDDDNGDDNGEKDGNDNGEEDSNDENNDDENGDDDPAAAATVTDTSKGRKRVGIRRGR